MGCGVGLRRGSDPQLLWLWRRPAATAQMEPPAREPPYATGAALKRQKTKKKKKLYELRQCPKWLEGLTKEINGGDTF